MESTFELSRQEPPVLAQSCESAEQTPSILLVDDQPARLLSYEAVLSNLGVECVRALSGTEALKHLLSKEFAAILLDVNMPEMDGFETARLIRGHPRMERIPIIFVTGVAISELDQLKGYEVGAIDYIPLPVVPEILRSKVAVLIELHQRRRILQSMNFALNKAQAELESHRGQAVAERDAMLHAMFEHPTELVTLLEAVRDTNGPVIDWRYRNANSLTLQILGLTRSELLGRLLTEVIPQDRAQALIKMCAEVLATRQAQRYEIQFKGKNLLVTLFPVGDESVISTATDITEQRAVATALADSRERLMLAQAAASIGIHDWNIRSNTIMWDQRTREIWGATHDELITYEVFAAGIHPDDLAHTQAAVAKALDRTGDGQYLATYRVINRVTASTRWIEATGRVYYDNDEPVRLVGTVQDITERVTAQTLLQESQLALTDASRRKDEFLAMLSHELRNPAAAINNAAQALSRLVQSRGQEQNLLGVIDRQIWQMSKLLDDLLDVARITQGHIEIHRERVALDACIDVALETAQPVIQAKHHRLTTMRGPEAHWVVGDSVRLAQCIANLLINAAKYTPSGGDICLQLQADDSTVVLEIRDTGQGIAPDLLPHIFDLFVQGDRSLDRSQGGLGIGLSLSRKLIEMHGGSIEASSLGINRGATFTIRLPRSRAPEAALDTLVAPERSTHRVMIVDDNQDAAQSLDLILRLDGHATAVAHSGVDALKLAPTFDPDFVLLDIGLPEMDGYEIARRMSTLIPRARLIAVTGYGLAEDRARSHEAGFESHLVKPVTVRALEAAFSQPARNTHRHT